MRILLPSLLVLSAAACAQPGGPPHRGAHAGPDHTPGWHMMTAQEREEHHRRMQAVRTPQECRQAMEEHRARMQARGMGPGMPMRDACAAMQP